MNETEDSAPESVSTGSEDQTQRMEHMHQRIGDALCAYLTLPDIDAEKPNLEDDFYADFRGEHATLADALRAQVEGLGWAEDLRRFAQDHAIPEHILIWDFGFMKTQMDEIYDFVQYKEKVYLFLR